ncbi:hypothetical protein C8K30_1011049 [Promicromonospora sp. AC04]|uniref:hypothetical protein n=1 Tax=Promicromonospora sp. AC04 TaxID=2135723 RepID=UPI000D4F078A|nr:hypothetical protein [Promicromonospora sp. AC04]PUB32523.1 hypothetical protein C8K30_1011049 [Promicromonospora sp. AC04]
MAAVSACAYDARGRLIPPDPLDIGRAKIGLDLDLGGLPTFDSGYTHVFVVSASGVTPDHARERVREKLHRFFERAGAVHGFRKIGTCRTAGENPLNRNTTINYEILYAVEGPEWSRGPRPAAPHGHYQRDRDAAVYV